jgi:hypothetical protein
LRIFSHVDGDGVQALCSALFARAQSEPIGSGSAGYVYRAGHHGELIIKRFGANDFLKQEEQAAMYEFWTTVDNSRHTKFQHSCANHVLELVKDCPDGLVYPYLGQSVSNILYHLDSSTVNQKPVALSDCGLLDFLAQVTTYRILHVCMYKVRAAAYTLLVFDV